MVEAREAPRKRKGPGVWGWLGIGFVGIAIVAALTPEKELTPEQQAAEDASVAEYTARTRATELVKASLRDPDSAVFSGVIVRDRTLPTVCGYVNARNGFGGMTGATEWVVVGPALTMRGQPGGDDSGFVDLWNSVCARQAGG